MDEAISPHPGITFMKGCIKALVNDHQTPIGFKEGWWLDLFELGDSVHDLARSVSPDLAKACSVLLDRDGEWDLRLVEGLGDFYFIDWLVVTPPYRGHGLCAAGLRQLLRLMQHGPGGVCALSPRPLQQHPRLQDLRARLGPEIGDLPSLEGTADKLTERVRSLGFKPTDSGIWYIDFAFQNPALNRL
jgi:hypothetical protein